MRLPSVYNAVIRERQRQNKIYPAGIHAPIKWLAILAEEFGEVAKAVMEADEQNTYDELVQVAAVVVGWLEDIEEARQNAV